MNHVYKTIVYILRVLINILFFNITTFVGFFYCNLIIDDSDSTPILSTFFHLGILTCIEFISLSLSGHTETSLSGFGGIWTVLDGQHSG